MRAGADRSFGEGGIAAADLGLSRATATGIGLQEDGRLVVVGTASNGEDDDVVLVRYESDGSLDRGFGARGRVIADFGGFDHGRAVALQDDGKILVAGSTFNPNRPDGDFLLVRYRRDGRIDRRFGSRGAATTDFRELRLRERGGGRTRRPDRGGRVERGRPSLAHWE